MKSGQTSSKSFSSANALSPIVNTTKMIKGVFDLKFASAKDILCLFTISNDRRKKIDNWIISVTVELKWNWY